MSKPFKFSYSPDDSPPIEMFIPDVSDWMTNSIRHHAVFYEQDLLLYLRAEIPHGKTIIDVGANIGNHTLFFSKFMDARVLAIEPHPTLFGRLLSTIEMNRLGKVTALRSAVGDSPAFGELKVPDKVEHTNWGSFTLEKVDRPALPVTVRVESLPALLKEAPSIDIDDIVLVKIDVEGWECKVLEGMMDIIKRITPDFAIETRTPPEFNSVMRILGPFGYKVSRRFCGTPTYRFSTKL